MSGFVLLALPPTDLYGFLATEPNAESGGDPSNGDADDPADA